MKRTTNLVIALLFSSVLFAAAQQTTKPQAQPGMVPSTKATNPAPSSDAQGKTQKNSIGTGSLSVTTAQPVVFWQEQVAGRSVPTNFLYDSGAGILYAYREDDFTCSNGQTGHGGIMEALNTSGNKAGKPAGSGWWAVQANGGQCGIKQTDLYGCRFDASGNATECGAATVNNRTGEINLVTVQ
jgi:hypothetical protein